MRRLVVPVVMLAFSSVAAVHPAAVLWPAWISIESPANPFDRDSRDAVLLVHAAMREGVPTLADLNGTAQGIVDGARRSMPLRFDTTSHPGTFAVRKQWSSNGTWLLEISLRSTTAIVVLDRSGGVASVRVPTRLQGTNQIPRAVAQAEVDSTLAAAARR